VTRGRIYNKMKKKCVLTSITLFVCFMVYIYKRCNRRESYIYISTTSPTQIPSINSNSLLSSAMTPSPSPNVPNIMRHDRDGAAEGGLLIYVRDRICISRIRNLETPLDAIIWVLIQVNGQSFLLCNTYRSHC
jgi:hypothetical protein